MLSLTKELEHSFEYKGQHYELDLSFDNVLRWYELLEDDGIDDYGKVSMAFEMFYNACALDSDLLVTGVDAIADYIHQEPYGHYEDNTGVGTSDPIRYYSYSQDADAIYSSFVEQYGIDLIEQQGKLHWDKFKALMAGLNDKTYFRRILSIRMRDTQGMEGQEVANMMELKQYYELDDNRSVEVQDTAMNDIFSALKNEATR